MPCWKWSGDRVSDLRYFPSCQKEGVVVDAKWLTDNTGSGYIIRRGGSLSCSARDGSISVVGWHPVLLLPEKFSKSSCPVGQITCIVSSSQNLEPAPGNWLRAFSIGRRPVFLGAPSSQRAHCRKASQSALPSEPFFLNIAGTRERAGTRAWQVHVRTRPHRGAPQADCVRRDRVRA